MQRGQIVAADRRRLAGWLQRFADRDDVAFAAEACTGWRYVIEELQRAGVAAHLAEPADTAAARGRKRRAKTDRADAKLIRTLLTEDRLPECYIPPASRSHRQLASRDQWSALYCGADEPRRSYRATRILHPRWSC